MKNLDELLEEAKEGKLTEKELAYVVQRIQESNPGDNDSDLYVLIHILGRSGNSQYRKLVERFLCYPSDPMISSIALRTLCSYWGFTSDYLEQIKKILGKVDWDVEGDVLTVAISIAGEFVRHNPEKELLRLLLHLFEEEPLDEIALIDQESAFLALARAVGKEWNEIENLQEYDCSVIEKAYQLLKE